MKLILLSQCFAMTLQSPNCIKTDTRTDKPWLRKKRKIRYWVVHPRMPNFVWRILLMLFLCIRSLKIHIKVRACMNRIPLIFACGALLYGNQGLNWISHSPLCTFFSNCLVFYFPHCLLCTFYISLFFTFHIFFYFSHCLFFLFTLSAWSTFSLFCYRDTINRVFEYNAADKVKKIQMIVWTPFEACSFHLNV